MFLVKFQDLKKTNTIHFCKRGLTVTKLKSVYNMESKIFGSNGNFLCFENDIDLQHKYVFICRHRT